jgi:hypothetical protein
MKRADRETLAGLTCALYLSSYGIFEAFGSYAWADKWKVGHWIMFYICIVRP